jgi:hypothetical protein
MHGRVIAYERRSNAEGSGISEKGAAFHIE